VKRLFVTSFDLSAVDAMRPDLADQLVEHVAWAAWVRGIHPTDIYVAPPSSVLREVYTVVGERTEEPGWDANGAPVETWPAASLPWGDPADERGVA